ncbi:MAG: hypothetical protein ACI3V5_04775 [Faecousia sp.]
MKKTCTWILTVLVALALCGCGKSEAVKKVEAMIDAIGTVTVESQTAIDSAMEAYNALTEEEAAKVENYGVLKESADDCLELRLIGKWVYEPTYFYNVEEMYDKVTLSLNEDMTADGEHVSGKWRVEGSELMINNGESDYLYHIYREGGKLAIGSINSKMMRVEDYNALLDEMFVIVELTPENVADYCRCTIYTEIEKDAFGTLTGDTRTYATLESTVYDDGLIYLDGSDDLAIELLVPEHQYQWRSGQRWRTRTSDAEEGVVKRIPYGSWGVSLGSLNVDSDYEAIHEITAEEISFGRVMGKITYIRSEYVETIKEDDGSRIIVLKTGEEIHAGTWKEGLTY